MAGLVCELLGPPQPPVQMGGRSSLAPQGEGRAGKGGPPTADPNTVRHRCWAGSGPMEGR
eukprot:5674851-Alexandrium_andersonii.AAC.1